METFSVTLPTLPSLCVWSPVGPDKSDRANCDSSKNVKGLNSQDESSGRSFMMMDYSIKFQSVEAAVAPKRRVDLALTKPQYYSFMSTRHSKGLKQHLHTLVCDHRHRLWWSWRGKLEFLHISLSMTSYYCKWRADVCVCVHSSNPHSSSPS